MYICFKETNDLRTCIFLYELNPVFTSLMKRLGLLFFDKTLSIYSLVIWTQKVITQMFFFFGGGGGGRVNKVFYGLCENGENNWNSYTPSQAPVLLNLREKNPGFEVAVPLCQLN